MAFDFNSFGAGMGGLFGGLFGGSHKPYKNAQKEYQKWLQQAQAQQQPWIQAGQGALGDYQGWLKGQQDPSGFVNNLMQNYQQSPYIANLQRDAQNAGINAASASGLTGSTPFAQQLQQNATNISQQGMNDWLQNVLGINTQYGQGQQNLMQMGQNSANALSGMYGQAAPNMAQLQYNRKAGQQQDMWNSIGGLAQIAAMFL